MSASSYDKGSRGGTPSWDRKTGDPRNKAPSSEPKMTDWSVDTESDKGPKNIPQKKSLKQEPKESLKQEPKESLNQKQPKESLSPNQHVVEPPTSRGASKGAVEEKQWPASMTAVLSEKGRLFSVLQLK